MSIKRWSAVLALLLLPSFLVGCGSDSATSPELAIANQVLETGNGAPSGKHFNLNIIGVPKDKMHDIDANNDNGVGNRIFVQLVGGDVAGDLNGQKLEDISKVNKIFLQAGPDFAVLDADATAEKGNKEADGALFQLPADVAGNWMVFARPLGPKNKTAVMTTCSTILMDPDGVADSGDEYEEVICSEEDYVAVSEKGKKFEDVTTKLLYLTVEVDDSDGIDELEQCLIDDPDVQVTGGTASAGLFNDCYMTWFWNYKNDGLKLLQLRFYAMPDNG